MSLAISSIAAAPGFLFQQERDDRRLQVRERADGPQAGRPTAQGEVAESSALKANPRPQARSEASDNASTSGVRNPSQLSPEETQALQELQSIDRQVRAHEQAHLSAGGQHASGGMQLEYQVGPDGKSYAVAGEVQIDLSQGSTPEATLQKAMQIQQAATAPAEPSGQDMRVAAMAQQMIMEARAEISEKKQTEQNHQVQPADGQPNGVFSPYERIMSMETSLGHSLDVRS